MQFFYLYLSTSAWQLGNPGFSILPKDPWTYGQEELRSIQPQQSRTTNMGKQTYWYPSNYGPNSLSHSCQASSCQVHVWSYSLATLHLPKVIKAAGSSSATLPRLSTLSHDGVPNHSLCAFEPLIALLVFQIQKYFFPRTKSNYCRRTRRYYASYLRREVAVRENLDLYISDSPSTYFICS